MQSKHQHHFTEWRIEPIAQLRMRACIDKTCLHAEKEAVTTIQFSTKHVYFEGDE